MLLKKEEIENYLNRLIENTSNNNLRSKVELILRILPENGRVNLFTLFTTLFPNGTEKNYSSQFSRFKNELNNELIDLEIPLKIFSEKKQNTPLTEKFAYFEKDEDIEKINAEKQIEKFPKNLDEKSFIPTRAEKPNEYKIFVSFAGRDIEDVQNLISELEIFLNNIDENVKFNFWKYDHKLLAGEDIDGEIEKAIDECDFGLLMISHYFMGSEYIKTKELPKFVGKEGKFAIPVSIYKLEHNRYAPLKQIEDKYFFQYKGKGFNSYTKKKKKVDFACSLADTIFKTITKRNFQKEYKTATDVIPLIFCDESKEKCETDFFINTRAKAINAEARRDSEIHIGADGVDVVSYITDWYLDLKRTKYFALLGDSGMGKTFSCMKLAKDLIALKKQNRELKIPIYLDLRFFAQSVSIEEDFKIEKIIEVVVEESKEGFAENSPLEEIRKEIRRGNAFIIFDGLDEVLVHLEDKRRADKFIGELRKVANIEGDGVNFNRVLISCRTNYFPTLKEQFSLLSGNSRALEQKRDFEVLNLLPFKWSQIEEYCAKIGVNFQNFKDLITSIHNLEEMVTKPFTLKLITEQIEKLEQKKAEGKTVNSASIYFNIVEEWLARDYGKHIFTEKHKPKIMRDLSLYLWGKKTREIPYEKLDDWLYEWLGKYPAISNRYLGKERDKLSNDLRTATFIVRPGVEKFMFAHTSLQEFFIAWGIFEKILEKKFDELDIVVPSQETLDFLVDIFLDKEEEQENFRENFQKIFQGDYTKKNLLGFEIFYLFQKRAIELKAVISLENEELREREFIDADLSKGEFLGCKLSGTFFKNCNLSGGDLKSSFLNDTRFINTKLKDTSFKNSELQYSKFKNSPIDFTKDLNQQQRGLENLKKSIADSLIKKINLGHQYSVRSIAITSDSKYIVSGSSDKTLKIWEMESGECIKTLEGHQDTVSSVAITSDAKYIVSSSSDKTLEVWEVESGECIKTLEGHQDSVNSVAITPDSQYIVSSSNDKTLKVWEVETGECIKTLEGHKRSVEGVAITQDSKYIVSGSCDNTLKIWEVKSGECIKTLEGHQGCVLSVVITPDSKYIVSGSSDETLKIWELESGKCIKTLEEDLGYVFSIAITPDSKYIVFGSDDGILKILELESGECIKTLEGHQDTVSSVVITPDSKYIVSSSYDESIKIWEVESGECIKTLDGHQRTVENIAITPDSKYIVSGSDDSTFKIWELESGECIKTLDGHQRTVENIAITPDSKYIVSGSDDSTFKIWELESGECIKIFEGHQKYVDSVAITLDSKYIVSGSRDETLKIWEVESGECIKTLEGHQRYVNSVAITPDSKYIVSGSDDSTLKIWKVESGECIKTLEGHQGFVSSVAITPDSKYIVSAGSLDRRLKIWELASGECIKTLEGHQFSVNCVAITPDSKYIVSGSDDSTLKIWELASGECIKTLEGHQFSVNSVAITPDSKYIVSGSDDGTLKIWEIESGECIKTFYNLGVKDTFTVNELTGKYTSFSGNGWEYCKYTDGEKTYYADEVQDLKETLI